MNLDEYILELSFGELRNIAIGNGKINDGKRAETREMDYPLIISHINKGLALLHTKFPLSIKEVAIDLCDHISDYQLDSDFAQSNTDSPEKVKYLADSKFDPFLNDVLCIEAIFDEHGHELNYNDANHPNGIKITGTKTITVPFGNPYQTLFVRYRAAHGRFALNLTDDQRAKAEIVLPHVLYPALSAYVASCVHGGRNSQEAKVEQNTYFQMFQYYCNEVTLHNNVHSSQTATNFNLDNQGWI